jgi:oxygen-dependent protoporphyrinogen oxidase
VPSTVDEGRPDRPDVDVDVVIIGGGAAGLASAWALRDRNLLLLEQEQTLGGRMKSEPRGEYWLNLGAHLFPGSGSAISDLVHALGLETIEIPGSKSGMYFEGKVRIAKRIETFPLILPLTFRERISFAVTGLRLLALVKRWQRISKPRRGESRSSRVMRMMSGEFARSFRQYAGRLPARVADIFETAARRASCEMSEQSAAVGAALFASHWSGKKDSTALNVLGGSGRIGAAMQEKLADRARLGARVEQVREQSGRVEVTYRDADGAHVVTAAYAIVAVPAPFARELVADLPPDLDQALQAAKYGQFLVMSMTTTETGPMPWDDVYALATPGLAFSMFFNHANPVRRPGTRSAGGSLMCYAGGDSARRGMELSDAEIEKIFKDDLYKMYPQLRGKIAETIVQRWPVAGHYRGPGDETLPTLLGLANRDDSRIHFAGDYFAPLGQMEVAAQTGVTAATHVDRKLGARLQLTGSVARATPGA